MNQSRLTSLLFSASLVFFFSSCRGGGDEKTASKDAVTADTAAMKPVAPVSTIVTTAEHLLVITQKVKDYGKWKIVYDAHDSVRLGAGVHNYVIGRSLHDSMIVLVALKVDDTAKAKAFAKDPGLKKVMIKGGVVGDPIINFITEAWQDTATIDSRIRSRTMLTVKDWDIWLKAFEGGKQERLDNGITDRTISHDLNDNKKVFVVTAITDSAKAYAYFKSDALKKRRAESGVIGEPVRFLFRIVARY